MARDFGGRSRSVNKHWTPFQGNAQALSAGSIGVNVAAAQHDRETIIRTRGNVLSYVDGTAAPGQLALISIGLILVPEGTSTTVLWSPFTDGDAPWFWYEAFAIGHEEAVTDVVEYAGLGLVRSFIDSKAMRRVKNEEIQLVVENTTLATALTSNTVVAGRFLTQDT